MDRWIDRYIPHVPEEADLTRTEPDAGSGSRASCDATRTELKRTVHRK